jgi:ribosomal protein S18 acetylase RimI-like enzyme
MLVLKRATLADLDFLVEIDLEDEGVTHVDPQELTAQDRGVHRTKIAGFVTDPDQAAWLYRDTAIGRPVAAIMCRFRDRHHEPPTGANRFLFRFIGTDFLPPDGRFCEVFQLWVDPAYRRQGLATRLKRHVEMETRRRGISLIYTHTEARNTHVIELNRKLGYREIRRGPIWDEVVRVSLVKQLGPDQDRGEPILIREMEASDCRRISEAFAAQGWAKPVSQYERYWAQHAAGSRLVLVAEVAGEFAGYLTIVWESGYAPFRAAGIPEIVDFNVLIKQRRKGAGNALMDQAERRIGERSAVAGLRVGLLADYGAAQILYARRGYIPDGGGLYHKDHHVGYFDEVVADDDLTLALTKRLDSSTEEQDRD